MKVRLLMFGALSATTGVHEQYLELPENATAGAVLYREMAEPMLRRVAEEAAERWPLLGVCILHRVGDLPVGEQTVIIACSAPHRQEAFAAARYGIDEVKRRVPVWKKEIGPAG